jgi:hypothetical protein
MPKLVGLRATAASQRAVASEADGAPFAAAAVPGAKYPLRVLAASLPFPRGGITSTWTVRKVPSFFVFVG